MLPTVNNKKIQTVVDKKKGKSIERGEVVAARINKMQIAQGNVVLYAALE